MDKMDENILKNYIGKMPKKQSLNKPNTKALNKVMSAYHLVYDLSKDKSIDIKDRRQLRKCFPYFENIIDIENAKQEPSLQF